MTTNSRREQPSTYFVQDRRSKPERERVTLQDQMITRMMGGVLPEQEDPTIFHRVLDVGCGTGNWLVEAAKSYPSITTLVGVDVSIRMVDFARELAKEQGVSDRVDFHVMDALRMIEFPPNYFDLVNQRMGWSYLRTWDWPELLQEYQRVTRGGGVIRITESGVFVETNSPALTQYWTIVRDAFFHAGHLFENRREGVTSKLADLLHQCGLCDVQTRSVVFDYSEPSEDRDIFIEDHRLGFRTTLPFLQKWSRVPIDYDQICQRAIEEMSQPEFTAQWEMVTAWGTNVQHNNKIPTTEHRS